MHEPVTTRPEPRGNPDDGGFVLTVVVVFMVLVMIAASSSALLTRANGQIVSNKQAEARAFYIAEAGVTEALLRLDMKRPTTMTVNGRTFDASIVPVSTDPTWTGTILLGSFAPSTSGSTFVTPTIQASELAYSAAAAGADALTLRWVSDGAGGIRKAKGLPLMDVVVIGRSGLARRRVTQQVSVGSPIATVLLNPTACPGLSAQGGGSARLPGYVAVNST
ncbi:MAG: hypothetical protein ACREQ9_12975, partial [Candidatus Binatia bacterium]